MRLNLFKQYKTIISTDNNIIFIIYLSSESVNKWNILLYFKESYTYKS